MRVAIHQPNLVPWVPFFKKMESVDVFVILRHCQFNREVYQHRFRYNERWYTLSITGPRMSQIIDVRYARPWEDWNAIKRKLPQFERFFGRLDFCIGRELWRTNETIIEAIRQDLKIPTEIRLDSPTELTGTARLVDICQELGATTYLAGASGHDYMDLELFKTAGIQVEFQRVNDVDKRHVFETTEFN